MSFVPRPQQQAQEGQQMDTTTNAEGSYKPDDSRSIWIGGCPPRSLRCLPGCAAYLFRPLSGNVDYETTAEELHSIFSK